jgi:hypothetical protein
MKKMIGFIFIVLALASFGIHFFEMDLVWHIIFALTTVFLFLCGIALITLRIPGKTKKAL